MEIWQVWFEGFDKKGPKYIKSILNLNWSNHFQRVFVLNLTTIRIKIITQDKLSINFATERRLKVKLEIYKTLSKTWSWLIKIIIE